MSYKITNNIPFVIQTTRQKAAIFLRFACDEMINISTPNTPKSASSDASGKKASGNLRRDLLKQVLGLQAKIKWRKKYATYQERGKRADGTRVVKKYTTPGTGPHFAENAAKELPKRTQQLARKAGMI